MYSPNQKASNLLWTPRTLNFSKLSLQMIDETYSFVRGYDFNYLLQANRMLVSGSCSLLGGLGCENSGSKDTAVYFTSLTSSIYD